MKTHPCAIPGCNVGAQGRMLMCYDHWKLVPKTLKSEVWKWLPNPGQQKSSLYQEAVANAVASVREAELVHAEQSRQQKLL